MTNPDGMTADQWTAPPHEHRNSVFVKCRDCLLFGVPMPGDYTCGNCLSQNTVSYPPICCVQKALTQAHEEGFMDCMKKLGGIFGPATHKAPENPT